MRYTTNRGAALLGLLFVLPLAFLEFRYNSDALRKPSDLLVLFGLLWLLPASFFSITGSLVRAARTSGVVSGKLFAGTAFLLLLAVLWGSLVADQLPCFLGTPNCD